MDTTRGWALLASYRPQDATSHGANPLRLQQAEPADAWPSTQGCKRMRTRETGHSVSRGDEKVLEAILVMYLMPIYLKVLKG